MSLTNVNVVNNGFEKKALGEISTNTSGIIDAIEALTEMLGTDSISFHIATGENKTFTLMLSAAQAMNVDKVVFKTTSGTITGALKINGTNITGLSALSFTSAEDEELATAANSLAVGDTLTLVTSSNSAAVDIVGTIYLTRTP